LTLPARNRAGEKSLTLANDQHDARVVRQLKIAGATAGQQNQRAASTHGLAIGTIRSMVAPTIRQALNLERSPGGSSGAAAAVASGMVPIEYGTTLAAP
jgi:amidase